MLGRSEKEGCEDRNLEELIGFFQRSKGVRVVGREEQEKRWEVVSSWREQRGQEGDGVRTGSILCWKDLSLEQ